MNTSALKYRNFQIYMGGNVLALNALWMQRVTIGWLAWSMTSSASFVGLVSFINFLPTILTGPFFGVWVDRLNVKRAALVTQSSMLILGIALYLTHSLGALTPVVLGIISGLSGLITAAHNPIRMSLAPRLVPREDVASVVNFVAINFNLARMTGPAIGGWIIAVWGVGSSLLLQIVFFMPFIVALSLLTPRERKTTALQSESFLTSLAAGLRHAWETPLIRHAVMLTGSFAFISRGTLELMPVFADGVFQRGAAGLGILTSSAGLGAVLAGLGKMFMQSQAPGRLPKPAMLSSLIGAALVPVLAFSTNWYLTVTLAGCLGCLGTFNGISMQTAIQIELDDDMRGRVMSLWVMVAIGATAFGAMLMGLLADLVGLIPAVAGMGLAALCFIALLLFRIWD